MDGPTKQWTAIIVCMYFFSTLAVILRLVAKLRTKARVNWDDFWILCALVVYYGYLGVICWDLPSGGAGLVPQVQTLPELIASMKAYYWSAMLTVPTMTCTKFSVLCFYRRIFITEFFKRATLIIGIICLIWGVTFTTAFTLKCAPISASWDPLLQDQCLDFETIFIVSEVPNCLLDFVIVFLPINALKSLQLPLRYKISIAFIFFLGGFVGVMSIIRMALTYSPTVNPQYALISNGTWATLQLGFAILCACFPVYRPLFPERNVITAFAHKIFSFTKPSSNGSGSISNSATKPPTKFSNRNKFDNDNSKYTNLSESSDKSNFGRVEVSCNGTQDGMANYPMRSINVKKTVEIV